MKHRITSIAIFAGVLLAGCATRHPQTADEFRRAVPGAAFMKTETFEVNRAFSDVARTFKRKAGECLNLTIRTTSTTRTSHQVIDTAYKPTVIITKQRAELHVQQDYKSGVLVVGQPPKGGFYLLITDAYPVSRQRTRIEMFMPSIGHKVLIEAIKGWASGKNLGCPDMTKV